MRGERRSQPVAVPEAEAADEEMPDATTHLTDATATHLTDATTTHLTDATTRDPELPLALEAEDRAGAPPAAERLDPQAAHARADDSSPAERRAPLPPHDRDDDYLLAAEATYTG